VQFAWELRRLRLRPSDRWHLDEMVVTIRGVRFWLWLAVGSEGKVLDLLVQSRRNTAAAVRLMRKLLRKQGFVPQAIVTDQLRSCMAAVRELGLSAQHDKTPRQNNRAENSHLEPVVMILSRRRRGQSYS
jgi:transposase-like protein